MKKYTLWEKIKHFGAFISYLFFTVVDIVKDKRTWLVVAFITWTYLIAWFNANYYTQSPVKQWQPMIVPRHIKKQAVVPVKASETKKQVVVPKTEKEIVMGQKWGAELWKIYFLESTHGKNDGCRLSGKFGGFGVMEAKGKPACYDTFEEAAIRANYWYDLIRSKYSLTESLCMWNTGVNVNKCNYSDTYLVL